MVFSVNANSDRSFIMHRFYINQRIEGNTLSITDTGQLHHIRDVLRLKAGDEVTVFDSAGNECACSIATLNKKQMVLTVKSRRHAEVREARLTVACAIPKKGGMDEIIDNLTQLGVDDIIPLKTERVIVRLDEGKRKARLERWQRIAQSAAQQSQRSSIPLVEPITSMESVLARSPEFDLKLIPTLSGERRHVREALAEFKHGSILVLIGPEGDFTSQEVERAKSAGFIPVSLGDNILRVGTAAVAVVSYIRFSLE